MRLPALLILVTLSGCATLPPAPLTPLPAGDVALGLTLGGDWEAGIPELNVWVGAGLGSGIDAAVGVLAPLELVSRLRERGEGGRRPLVPPFSLRKTFENGLGVGIGGASVSAGAEQSLDYSSMLAPFVTVGPRPGVRGGTVGRATVYVGYGVVHRGGVAPGDSAAGETRRGLAVWATAEAGRATGPPDSVVVPLARAGSGLWLGPGVRVMRPRVAIGVQGGGPIGEP